MVEIIHQHTVSEDDSRSAQVGDSVLACIQMHVCMYTKPIGGIVARHDMNHHCYFDDIQMYLTVDREHSTVAALTKVELCVTEVAAWLTITNKSII